MNIKSYFQNRKLIEKIKLFNKKNFSKNISQNKNIILCEFSTNKSNQVSFSLFLNALQKKNESKIVAYNTEFKNIFLTKIKKGVYSNFQLNHNYDLYKSFNVSDFITINKNHDLNHKAKIKLMKLYKKIKNKSQLLKLKIEGIWIGDLIYDTYLRINKLPTVDLNASTFKEFLKDFIYFFYFWIDYFKKNKVTSVISSHSVYFSALPMRIGIKRGSNVYQVNFNNIYKLTDKRMFGYDLFSEYKKIFNSFSPKLKKKALNLAKKQCLKRFSGEVGVDMHYSTKSAFSKYNPSKQILDKSKKKKILIAAHCFLDNPHPYGIENIFNDFYEWFEHLCNFSKKTNFDWYVKTHPDFMRETHQIVQKFLTKYKNINLIPANTSHHQLIREGINCVLTVHGTITWEYAYFKIPVISSSYNNPHKNFNFSYHAKNKKDLEWAIKNSNKLNLKFSKDDIYKFYFMHNIYNSTNWIVKDNDILIKKIGGYKNISNLKFYQKWISQTSKKKIVLIQKRLQNYIKSKKFIISSYN